MPRAAAKKTAREGPFCLKGPRPAGLGRFCSDHEQRATRKSLTRELLGLLQANDV